MDPQKVTIATYSAGGAGLALIVASFLFPYIFPDHGAWSNDDGQAYAAAAAELYRLTHVHAGHNHSHGASAADEPTGEPADLAVARKRFEEEKERLHGAVGGRHWGRAIVLWTGVLCVLAAVAGVVFLRLRDDS